MDWFRSWHGAPTDNKWMTIANRAGVEPGKVAAIFWALLDYASQRNERGSVAGFDVETYAIWSGWSEAEVLSVLSAMRAKGVITDGDTLAAWEKRQPKREDDSAERVARYRSAQRASNASTPTVTHCNADVTHGNADVTHGNADVTHGNAPDKNREDLLQVGRLGIPTLPTVSAPEPEHGNGNGAHPAADTASILAAHRGHGSADPHDAAPMAADSDAAHSFALLVDREVGVDPIMARKLSDAFPFDEILRHVFQARRDIASGSINSFGILNNRLLRHTAAMVSTVDKQSPLYLRHCESPYAAMADDAPVTDPAPARRTAQAKPAPEPGTPAAIWAQLQQDYALTQPTGSMDNLIADSCVVAYDEDAGTFEIGLADASRLDWAQKKLSTQVGRKLAIITGRQAVGVKFVAVEVGE